MVFKMEEPKVYLSPKNYQLNYHNKISSIVKCHIVPVRSEALINALQDKIQLNRDIIGKKIDTYQS